MAKITLKITKCVISGFGCAIYFGFCEQFLEEYTVKTIMSNEKSRADKLVISNSDFKTVVYFLN